VNQKVKINFPLMLKYVKNYLRLFKHVCIFVEQKRTNMVTLKLLLTNSEIKKLRDYKSREYVYCLNKTILDLTVRELTNLTSIVFDSLYCFPAIPKYLPSHTIEELSDRAEKLQLSIFE